jgi:hypothetical protein
MMHMAPSTQQPSFYQSTNIIAEQSSMKQGQMWQSQLIQLATKNTTLFFSKGLESESQVLPANTFAVLTTIV